MRLRLGDAADDGLVAFGWSAGYEALRSLHVLHDVKHHPLHISWALEARARMSPELDTEADRFAFWYLDRPLLFREIWAPTDVQSWAHDLSALREAPIEDFAEQLIHAALARKGLGPRTPLDLFLRDEELHRQARAHIEARHPASLTVLRELIADPEGCRQRFAGFLSSYWQACIAPDWPDLETHLRDDVARHGRALSRRGLQQMLEELSPHVWVDHGTGDIVIRRPGRRADTKQIELALTDSDQLLLVPSHFVWPELTAVAQKDTRSGREQLTVLIVYALGEMQRQGRAPVPPEELLKLLRSAGDTTRLQILQLLAQRPRSTKEIAGLIGLTEAAISKHLKLLHEAGWVKPKRQSYYVYYHLARDSAARLTHALNHLIG